MSKEQIIHSVIKNKPEQIPLPRIKLDVFFENTNRTTLFKEKIVEVGGNVIEVDNISEIKDIINALYPKAINIYSTVENFFSSTIDIRENKDPYFLEKIDVAVIYGEFGVAENGAIWLSENSLPLRVLPFITKNLILILNKKKMYLNMHEAYQFLRNSDNSFGVFISGPSKTADIEQCLVIGAQGALGLDVILV